MGRSTRFPNLREFRARAARLGMATGEVDDSELPESKTEPTPILPLIWITLGLASAGWLAWAALTPSMRSAPSAQSHTVEPTRIIAAGEPPDAIDQRLANIESELLRLQRSTAGANAAISGLAQQMSTVEQAFGPVTGSLRPIAPPGSAAMANSARSQPTISTKGDAQSFGNTLAPTAPRVLTPSGPISFLPPTGDERQLSTSMPAFALDLGGFDSIEMLYDRWAILTATDKQFFGGLAARTVTNIDLDGTRTFHLLAGPFNNVGETGRMCAELVRRDITCTQTMFIGEPL